MCLYGGFLREGGRRRRENPGGGHQEHRTCQRIIEASHNHYLLGLLPKPRHSIFLHRPASSAGPAIIVRRAAENVMSPKSPRTQVLWSRRGASPKHPVWCCSTSLVLGILLAWPRSRASGLLCGRPQQAGRKASQPPALREAPGPLDRSGLDSWKPPRSPRTRTFIWSWDKSSKYTQTDRSRKVSGLRSPSAAQLFRFSTVYKA